jgi:hypothetical protein
MENPKLQILNPEILENPRKWVKEFANEISFTEICFTHQI